MKLKIATFLAAILALTALPLAPFAGAQATSNALAGVSFFTSVPATATQTLGPVKLPNFSGVGTLNITESGITGSPSGCTIKLYYSQNNATTITSAVVTQAFTPSTGIQQFAIAPSVPTGDAYTATYSCSSTYPTAGLISASFSPAVVTSASSSSTQAVTVSSGTLTAVTAITNPVSVNQVNTPGTTDPCQNAAVLKSSAVVSVATAGEASIVPLSAGKAIYVCAFTDASAGTTPSITFQQGTVAGCATGTTAITGAIPFTSGSAVNQGGGGGTLFSAAAGDVLCVLTVGTNHGGFVTYVQQ